MNGVQASGNAAPVSDDVRAARRSKLAEVIAGNSQLQSCTAATASAVAAALEASVYQPGITAAQHSAGLRQLVSAVKTASSWLDLPFANKLQGPGLSAVLKLAVDAAVRDAAQLHKASTLSAADISKLEGTLLRLADLPITAAALEETGVAGKVKSMRKHRDPKVAAAASQIIARWRSAVS